MTMPFKELKDLTREQLSEFVGIEEKSYYIHEDGTDRALEVLSKVEESGFVCEKLDSALLTDWARKLLVDRYDGWEYVVADYIFDTPGFIKILNARDLKNLLICKGKAGYLNAWPDVESKLLSHGLMSQFFELKNKSLKDILNHLSNPISKEIIEKELERRLVDLNYLIENPKALTQEHLSKIITYEDASDIALKILKSMEIHISIRNKLSSELLVEWAKNLIVKRHDGWEYEVANYIFETPKLIKVFKPLDLIDLFIKGDVDYQDKWPNIESKLLDHGLINQFFSVDNKLLKKVLNHLNNPTSKKVIEEELERRESLSLDRKYSSVSTFFQQVEKQHTIDETRREGSSKSRTAIGGR